ncbi:hypothetical protein OA860_00570 [Prochlorococcus sp. AH-716-E13]|nr:hypothetical protein [Prochlorococcus sp. AH-716-E13]
MDIVFLGSGSLAVPLKEFLSTKYNSKIIPLRDTNTDEFKNLSNGSKSDKIYIDLMDPNKIDSNTKIEFLKKANKFRKIISASSNTKQYIYFSSANLYLPTFGKIFDDDQILTNTKCGYLTLKKETESFLKNLPLPLCICRIPNIWGHKSKKSFFSDLIYSYQKKLKIKYMESDKEVISFINIFDLSILIGLAIQKKTLGTLNLSTDSFDSRYNLKAKVNKENTLRINDLKGIRLSSQVIDWKKYFDKRRLPF